MRTTRAPIELRANTARSVYAVEARVDRWLRLPAPIEVFGSRWSPEPEVRFGSPGEAGRYLETVLDHLRGAGPDFGGRLALPVTVRPRRGAARAHYEFDTGTIALPDRRVGGEWALRELVLLHELAHHLTVPGDEHGAYFCRDLARLIELTGHPVLAAMTRIAMVDGGLVVAEADGDRGDRMR